LAALDRAAIKNEGKSISDQVRKEALGDEPNLEAAARRLVEEIASMRCVLRNLFRLANEAQEAREYIPLVEIYGSACVRLVRLLKIEKGNTGQLEAFLRESIDQAIREVGEDLSLGITGEQPLW
jgi:hypothetical protein